MQAAWDLRYRRPFADLRPSYSAKLDELLAAVSHAFARDDARGLWEVSQERIGEHSQVGDEVVSYATMCGELDADSAFRRVVFFRPLDFYAHLLDGQEARAIKGALDSLISFLTENDPEHYTG